MIALGISLFGLAVTVLSVVFFPVAPDPSPELRPDPTPVPDPSVYRPVYPDDLPEDPPLLPLDPGDKPWLVFVIDDAGYNPGQLERFLQTPAPMTIAVLPHLPYSEAASRSSATAGKEVILHMPMEAYNSGADPGPGAIFVGDSRSAIFDKTEAAFRSVPDAAGANNHMGSRVTGDYAAVAAFLDAMQALDSRKLFLDSRTTAASVAAEAAAQRGVPVVERDIFLDNDDTRAAIMQAIEAGKGLARRRGYAVMIGHVWSDELGDIISELYPELMEEGFHFGTLSELIAHLADENR